MFVLHVGKVADTTADCCDAKRHEVFVGFHIQFEIQCSEHTGGLK